MAQVFAQSVDKALGTAPGHALQYPSPSALVGRLPVDEKGGFDPKAQQPAFQWAVVKDMGFFGAQPHAFTEFGIAGEDRGPPAAKTGFHPLADLAV